MNANYLGHECHELILGEKLNGFKSPKTFLERERIIKLAKEWINNNPDKTLDLY